MSVNCCYAGRYDVHTLFFHASIKDLISDGSFLLLCMRMASAPASAYAWDRRRTSSNPQPAINASTRATMQKSGSCWESEEEIHLQHSLLSIYTQNNNGSHGRYKGCSCLQSDLGKWYIHSIYQVHPKVPTRASI